MSNFEILRFLSDEALAQAASSQWLKALEKEAGAVGPNMVALSGGRIARRLFAALASQAANRASLFGSVHFFWGDERCVPLNDPESNFGMASELLLRPLQIPDSQIHRIRGEAPPELAAKEAEIELRRVAGLRREDAATVELAPPAFDLIWLGLGEEGHTASLFPGEPPEVMANAAIYRPVTASKPPPRRITLGYEAIAAAREVWVLASGAGKEEALRNSLSPQGRTPLARVLQLRSLTKIFTDIAI